LVEIVSTERGALSTCEGPCACFGVSRVCIESFSFRFSCFRSFVLSLAMSRILHHPCKACFILSSVDEAACAMKLSWGRNRESSRQASRGPPLIPDAQSSHPSTTLRSSPKRTSNRRAQVLRCLLPLQWCTRRRFCDTVPLVTQPGFVNV
jgi:hypothetical protein